jgi:hypothetical protein
MLTCMHLQSGLQRWRSKLQKKPFFHKENWPFWVFNEFANWQKLSWINHAFKHSVIDFNNISHVSFIVSYGLFLNIPCIAFQFGTGPWARSAHYSWEGFKPLARIESGPLCMSKAHSIFELLWWLDIISACWFEFIGWTWWWTDMFWKQ